MLSSGGLMADVPCLDHSLGGCYGFPDDAQATLHVEPSPISDRTVHDGQSTRDECTHGRNAREPLLVCTRARLVPRAPVFES